MWNYANGDHLEYDADGHGVYTFKSGLRFEGVWENGTLQSDSIKADPKTEVEVDLPCQTVTNMATGKSEHFDINGYKKHCLMNGLDDIDFLVQNQEKTKEWEHGNQVC